MDGWHKTTPSIDRRAVDAGVFVLAVGNGLFADVTYGLQATPAKFAVSPVLLLVALVAVRAILIAPPARGAVRLAWLSALFLGMLAPASLAAWLAILTASALGLAFDRDRRMAHQFPLALAGVQIWKAITFKLLASPMLHGEALLLGGVLEIFGFAPVVAGNVVHVTPDHTLMLLSGCSAFSDMGLILVGWGAVYSTFNPHARLRVRSLMLVAAITVTLNLTRLVVMAFGAEWYHVAHNGWGASLYDMAICALVMSAGFWPVAQARVAAADDQAVPSLSQAGRAGWCCALVMAAVLSMTAKWHRYAHVETSGWDEARQQVKRDAAAGGFTLARVLPLTADGSIEAFVFTKDTCAGPLFVSLIGANGETQRILAEYTRGTPVELYFQGKPAGDLALLKALGVNALAAAARLIDGAPPVFEPLLAVAVPPPTSPGAACQWPSLRT